MVVIDPTSARAILSLTLNAFNFPVVQKPGEHGVNLLGYGGINRLGPKCKLHRKTCSWRSVCHR